MNTADAELMRWIRREFAKRPIDITRLDIQVVCSRVSIGGQLFNLRDQPTIDVREEFNIIEGILVKNTQIRSLSVQVRIIQAEHNKEEHEGRGRLRHA